MKIEKYILSDYRNYITEYKTNYGLPFIWAYLMNWVFFIEHFECGGHWISCVLKNHDIIQYAHWSFKHVTVKFFSNIFFSIFSAEFRLPTRQFNKRKNYSIYSHYTQIMDSFINYYFKCWRIRWYADGARIHVSH